MSSDLDTRLKTAVEERDRLAAEAQRIAGKKEAAEQQLETVEKEIRAKNLDPDTLDETVSQLETAFETAVENLEQAVDAARTSLAPYMENSS
jgi:predicted nuclease with TOPRIM domain